MDTVNKVKIVDEVFGVNPIILPPAMGKLKSKLGSLILLKQPL